MECVVTPRNVGILCRVCLTSSNKLIPLNSPVTETKDFTEPIIQLIEIVTLKKVFVDKKLLPSKICPVCLSYLKIAFEFQAQFKKSQDILEKTLKIVPVVDKTENVMVVQEVQEEAPLPPTVELICGENKFDLNDVVIVEENKEDQSSFQGFLNNLGSEISATFANKIPTNSHVLEQTQADLVVLPTRRKIFEERQNLQHKSKLDISRLKVRKLPEESKVIVEEINNVDCSETVVETLYECQLCQKILPSRKELDFHVSAQHSTPSCFVCHECGHISRTKSAFRHHMYKHSGVLFKCEYCGKCFDGKSHYNIHVAAHKNQRPYLCSVCGKTFNYSTSLKYHMRIHLGEKKYVCNFCGLKFRMGTTLTRHLRTHTKEKPYVCKYCDKTFCSRGEQVFHEMIHTGIRPYQCRYCDKRFTKPDNLNVHYLSHSGPHECQYCIKTFLDVKFLKLHLRRVHKEVEVKTQEAEN